MQTDQEGSHDLWAELLQTILTLTVSPISFLSFDACHGEIGLTCLLSDWLQSPHIHHDADIISHDGLSVAMSIPFFEALGFPIELDYHTRCRFRCIKHGGVPTIAVHPLASTWCHP